MIGGEHIHEQAAGLAALAIDDPDRLAAEAHAASCPACAEALQDAAAMLALLDALPPPDAPSPDALARTKAAVLAAPGWPGAPDTAPATLAKGPAAAVALTFVLLAIMAKHRSGDGRVWIEAGAAASIAAGAALSSRHRARLTLPLVLLASVALVATAGHGWEGSPALAGAKCVLFEILAAAVPLGFVAHGVLRHRFVAGKLEGAAFAAAGALAGQAALHLSCPDQASTPHLLPFHLGGVLLAGAMGAALAVPLAKRASAAS